MLSHTVTLWSVTEIEFKFFRSIFSTFKCSYFCFCMCWPLGANTWMWDISQSEIFSLCCVWASNSTEYFTLWECAGPGRPLHTYKQRENELLDTVFKANMSREQAKKHDIQLIGRPFQVLLPKFSCFKGPFACTIKVKANYVCNWIW